ncbi:MAG: hypothetical protein GF346_09645, partial [Candidatus Eisenbacteria bacterium]|nr:hypothetical protein [Candidatus Latescibacterota bacterium]MBD3302696.1 hypothetical protein [Candidatus Eisenbacteria bacterium]
MVGAIQAKSNLRRLIADWERLREMVVRPDSVPRHRVRVEKEFIRLKAQVAVRLTRLERSIPREKVGEFRDETRRAVSLLGRTRPPESGTTPAVPEEFERDWGGIHFYLNGLR